MPLPHLPNEIVDQIILELCRSYNDFCSPEYLYLRTLNRFYDDRISQLYLKNVPMKHTLLTWENTQHGPQVPDLFGALILMDVIETRDSRTNTRLGNDLYAAANVLHTQFERAGRPRSHENCLRDVCRALFRAQARTLSHQIGQIHGGRWVYHVGPDPSLAEASQTAFVVAVIMEYDDIVLRMLHTGQASATARSRVLDSPLEPAIKLGYRDLTRLILNAGVQIPSRPFGNKCFGPSGELYRAVVVASKRGYYGVLEPLLQRDATKELTHYVLKFTSKFGHWDIVTLILDHYLPRDKWELELTRQRDWDDEAHISHKLQTVQNHVLHYAARDGREDLILRLLQNDIKARTNKTGTKTFPLQQAAAGGQYSTCQLLLDRGAFTCTDYKKGSKLHKRNRLDALMRATARGGSIDILQLFQDVDLWTRAAGIALVVVAAEHGHLAMVQHAAAHNLDMPVKPKTPYKDRLAARGNDHHHTFVDGASVPLPSFYPAISSHFSFHGGDPLCMPCQRLAYRRDLRQFALLRAVAFGHAPVVEWLVTALDADPGLADPDDPPFSASCVVAPPARGGHPPLGLAVDTGNVEMVRLLRRLGAQPLHARIFRPEFAGSAHEAHERCVEFPAEVVQKLKLGARCRRYRFAGVRRQEAAWKEACWGEEEEDDDDDEDDDEDHENEHEDEDKAQDRDVEMAGAESDVDMGDA